MPKKTVKRKAPVSRGRSTKTNATKQKSPAKSPSRLQLVTSGNISANRSQISRRKRSQQSSEDEPYKERMVSAKAVSHWKPISKSSQALLVQIIDSAIVSVLSNTSSVAYSDVQDVLNSLKRRILEKSKDLKAPATKRPHHSSLEAECHKLERTALEASKQEEQLSEMIEELSRSIEEKEKILVELEQNNSSSTSTDLRDSEVHYLLQSKSPPKLGIPPLPKKRRANKEVEKQVNQYPAEVTKLLTNLDENRGLLSVRNYVTKLSDFVTLLPE